MNNEPADPLRSHACVEQRCALIEKNLAALHALKLGGARRAVKKAARPTKTWNR